AAKLTLLPGFSRVRDTGGGGSPTEIQLCCHPPAQPGKHKHRRCERPLSSQPSEPVIGRPGSRR
ncbi:unnamed protein product, partial [Pleuronectes platessa]